MAKNCVQDQFNLVCCKVYQINFGCFVKKWIKICCTGIAVRLPWSSSGPTFSVPSIYGLICTPCNDQTIMHPSQFTVLQVLLEDET